MTAHGASRSLLHTPAKVSSLDRLRSFSRGYRQALHAPMASSPACTIFSRLGREATISFRFRWLRKSAQKGYGLGRSEPMRFLDKCCWYKTFTKTATAVDRDLTAICPTSPRYAVLRPHAGSSSIHRAGSGRAALSDRLRYRQRL